MGPMSQNLVLEDFLFKSYPPGDDEINLVYFLKCKSFNSYTKSSTLLMSAKTTLSKFLKLFLRFGNLFI